MIQANELRLRNWVFNSTQNKPVRVDIKILQEQLYADIGVGTSWEPIPLTKEILLKCGFETSQWDCHSTFRKNICSDGCIVISLEHKHVEIGDLTLDIEIKYLHQLQNLFYCLCGFELDVNI